MLLRIILQVHYIPFLFILYCWHNFGRMFVMLPSLAGGVHATVNKVWKNVVEALRQIKLKPKVSTSNLRWISSFGIIFTTVDIFKYFFNAISAEI